MRSRLANIAAVLCCLMVAGGHWHFLQVVAWGTMVAAYAPQTGLSGALEQTFDGEHPCDMCQSIKNAKKQDSVPEAATLEKKLSLAQGSDPASFHVVWVMLADIPAEFSFRVRFHEVPAPPPRA